MSTQSNKPNSWFARLRQRAGPQAPRLAVRPETPRTAFRVAGDPLPALGHCASVDQRHRLRGPDRQRSDEQLFAAGEYHGQPLARRRRRRVRGQQPRQRRHAGGHGHQRRQRQVPVQQPFRRHLLRSAGSRARTGALVQPGRAEGGHHELRPARHDGHDDRLLRDDFAVRQRFAARRQDRNVVPIDDGRHRRPSQPVRATHHVRRRRATWARIPIGPACWTMAPTRRPTASSGSTGTATTATPPC